MSDDELSYFNIQPRSTEIITLVCSRCWGTGVGILKKKFEFLWEFSHYEEVPEFENYRYSS